MDLIDTNVVLRFLLENKGASFFKKLESGEIRVELKHIVLFQIIFVLKSFYRIDKDHICNMLETLFCFKGLYLRQLPRLKQMIDIYRRNSLEIVDCYLLAFVESGKNTKLYSYDRDFDRFGIARVEPDA